MGSVVYFLKKPQSSNKSKQDLQKIPHLIVLQFRYNGKKLTFTFNQKIEPCNWDSNRQRIKKKNQTTHDGKYYINELLDGLAKECERAYNIEIKNGIPDPKKLKNYLISSLYGKPEKQNENNLFALIERFISGEIKNRGKDKSYGSLNNYRSVLNHLKKYQEKKREKVDFDSVTLDFFYKLTHFLKHELKLAHNTIAKEIKLLKAFMSEAVDLGYTNNQAFRHKKFSVSMEKTKCLSQ